MVEVENTKLDLDEIAVAGAKPFVVAGIPAYNEEKTIAAVILGAQKFADAVVVCNDGSADLTGEISKRLGADVISHKKNKGYGAALRSLFRRAREIGADIFVTLDGDGQHDPGEIPSVLKPIVQGVADVVIGSRFIDHRGNKEMPRHRRVGAKVITMLVNGSSKNGLSDAQSGFRAYSRKAIEQLRVGESGMGASVEILLEAEKKGLSVCEVESSCKYHNGNVSNSTEHPLKHGVSVVMSIVRIIVEEKPLTALFLPGILCLFAGIVFGVWMMQIYASMHMIETNIALAALSFVMIGFFMLTTGITLYAISRLSKKLNERR